MMAVNIDERKFRPLDLVFRGDERGLWLVLVNRRHLLLLRRLVLLRHHGAWPNDERSKYGNENDGEKDNGSPGIHSVLGFSNVRLIFPQEGGPAPWNPLLEFAVMPQRGLFHFILLAGLGLVAGFLALAIVVPIEPQVPAPLIALFSPGLKLAEFVTPETGKSLRGRLDGFCA